MPRHRAQNSFFLGRLDSTRKWHVWPKEAESYNWSNHGDKSLCGFAFAENCSDFRITPHYRRALLRRLIADDNNYCQKCHQILATLDPYEYE